MIEENSDIFLAGVDAVVYLAEPVHKKYSTTFVWGNPFSTYVSYDRFFVPFSLYAPVHVFDLFPQLHKYLMDGLLFNQKTNKNIWISHLLKDKHSKKKLFAKK